MSQALTGAARRRIDCAMLDSLSSWFALRANGYSGPHSFNDLDVADMLARASSIVTPRATLVATEIGNSTKGRQS